MVNATMLLHGFQPIHSRYGSCHLRLPEGCPCPRALSVLCGRRLTDLPLRSWLPCTFAAANSSKPAMEVHETRRLELAEQERRPHAERLRSGPGSVRGQPSSRLGHSVDPVLPEQFGTPQLRPNRGTIAATCRADRDLANGQNGGLGAQWSHQSARSDEQGCPALGIPPRCDL